VNQRVLALAAVLAVAAMLFAAAPGFAADAAGSAAATVDSAPAIGSAMPAVTPIAEANYRIAEEDLLRLDVWGEPQLSNMQIPVTPGGTISVPYLGDLKAVGSTQAELAQEIAKRLADAQIVLDAKVQVTVLALHRPQVRVLGAVQRPGSFEFKDGDSVMDAVAQGGSYTEDALLESATLTHKGSNETVPLNLKKLFAGDLSQNYKLQNGDAIYIPHEDYNNKVFVLGQVNRPGQYSLKDNTTVLAAISLANGQTEQGSIRNTLIVRGDPKNPQKVKCDMRALLDKGDMTQNIVLQPGDIVVVPGSKKPDWSKIAQIISTATNLAWLRRTGW